MSGGLDAMFAPRSVAVIGASRRPGRHGHTIVARLLKYGFPGFIAPVNPNAGEVCGIKCFPSVSSIGQPIDLAIVCIPPAAVPEAIEQLSAAGTAAAVVISEGVPEDTRSPVESGQRRPAMRILGPNTVGFTVLEGPDKGMWASYRRYRGEPGMHGLSPDIAIVGQGGGFTNYLGEVMTRERGILPAYFIDTGDESDIGLAECLEYLRLKSKCQVIGIVAESARNARNLIAQVKMLVDAQRRCVVLPLSRTAPGSAAAQFHTGALSSGMEALISELTAAGAVVASDERDFVAVMSIRDAAVHLGRGIAIVGFSGGFGVQFADAAWEHGLDVVPFDCPVEPAEADALGEGVALRNPLDLGGYGPRGNRAPGAERLRIGMAYAARQPGVNGIVVWPSTAAEEHASEYQAQTEVYHSIRRDFHGPIMVCGVYPPDRVRALRAIGVEVFRSPTEIMVALSSLLGPPATHPDPAARRPGRAGADPGAPGQPLPSAASPGSRAPERLVTGTEALQIISQAGITTVRQQAFDLGVRAERLSELGWTPPLVLKVEARNVLHKSQAGAVRVVLGEREMERALDELPAVAATQGWDNAYLLCQQYVSGAIELAIGALIDPVVGPTVMVGSGGVAVEVLRDVSLGLAPLGEDRARAMIESLKIYPLLAGKRSASPFDITGTAQALVKLSGLIARQPQPAYTSIDINPLLVTNDGHGVIAVDAKLAEVVVP